MSIAHVLTLAFSLPLALDGESATNNDAALAALSIVSIVFGYLLLAGLWYFVFRDKSRARRKKDRRP